MNCSDCLEFIVYLTDYLIFIQLKFKIISDINIEIHCLLNIISKYFLDSLEK
jgi:hypothetical protein